MTSSKASASETRFTNKQPSLEGRVDLDPRTPRNIMSYSGADFTTLIYVPVANGFNVHQVTIDEIQDEIYELQNITRQLVNSFNQIQQNSQNNPLQFQSSLRDIQTRITSNERRISDLQRIQQDLRKSKANILPVILNSLQTVSVQMHVDKQPVRALGHSYPKAYTRGATLVAGSMIFTVIREHPLIRVIDTINAGKEFEDILPNFSQKTPTRSYDMFPTSATSNHLPPLHMTILGVNEAGNAVNMNLFGVEFLNDGLVLSIQDILTENTLSFVAQDIDIMRTLDTRGILNIPALSRAVTVSSFLTGPVAAARRARRGLPF